ncbi:diguanylate cyclase [Lysobacter yangpyeongensis]|uniref:diguanylate cyclase n=1 Tax=Lysobacter yangpyeongensis TaxID=346182 RepID=A0ABW0SI79_9GAMM
MRIAALAQTLAVLTLAWIPMDLLWLDPAHSLRVLPLRVAMASVLLSIARGVARLPASIALTLFVWSQAIGFGALQWQVGPAPHGAIEIGYGLFPFVLVAQLAVLPLPWCRTVLAALAPAANLVAKLLQREPEPADAWSEAWLFVLLAATAAWAGHAQLRLLFGLLGARRDAAHDALTGLSNRRSADARLEAERTRAQRLGEPLSVLMIDIDRFKAVNDHWGHAQGDRVLVALADVLRDELRGADLAARYGGEEFLVILPDTGIDAALDVAERIRQRIAALHAERQDPALAITASVGLAELAKGEDAATLVARADAALYAAKAGGRNRSVVAPGAGAAGASLRADV